MTPQAPGGISNQAVVRATGKSWQEWINILDTAGLKDTSHKQAVQWLWDNGYANDRGVPLNGWWAQSVIVGYEFHHGKRLKGQTAAAGFEVGVQKTIPGSAEEIWGFLTSTEGLRLWLGDLDDIKFKKGYRYRTSDGVSGQIRSVYPNRKLRLTLRPAENRPETTLQIYLTETKGKPKTSLRFHHEKLAGPKEREAMRDQWKEIAGQIYQRMINS